MKNTELRLGNFIKVDGEIQEMCELPLLENCTSDNTKLIPLTEEWLIKFGFITAVDPENIHYKKIVNTEFNEKFILNRKVGYEIFYVQHKDCNDYLHYVTQIKHVHQLQNLYFAFTGEEL